MGAIDEPSLMWRENQSIPLSTALCLCAWFNRDQTDNAEPILELGARPDGVEIWQERRDPIYYRLLNSFTLGSYEGSPGQERT